MAVKRVIHSGGSKEYLQTRGELADRRHIWRHLYVSRDVLGEYHREGEAQTGKSLTEVTTGCASMKYQKPKAKSLGIQRTGLLTPVNEESAEADLLETLMLLGG